MQNKMEIESVAIDEAAIDAAVMSLLKLKGMFGAIAYLISPDGVRTGYPVNAFEDWFADIEDKLEDVISLLSEA